MRDHFKISIAGTTETFSCHFLSQPSQTQLQVGVFSESCMIHQIKLSIITSMA